MNLNNGAESLITYSVIIPLYNKESYIARAIESVLNQTVHDFEIIIVDDGSTDRGILRVEEFTDPCIRLIRQENAGVSVARNRGIEEARGKWIAFLDADDSWKPHYLETISRLIEQYPEAGAYATAYEIIMPDGKVVRPKYKEIPPQPWMGLLHNYFRLALSFPPVWTGAVTIPRAVFHGLGAFAVGIPIGEDLDMWGRVALRYPIAFSSEIAASYYKEDQQHIGRAKHYFTNPEAEFVRTARAALERGEIKSVHPKDLLEYIAKLQISVGCECLLDGQNALAARKILFKTSPRTLRFKLKKCRAIIQTYLPKQTVRIIIKIKILLWK